MKIGALIMLVVGAALAAWVGYRLSPEATAMAVGMLFGMLAGVPITLLLLAGNRRQARDEDGCDWDHDGYPPSTPAHAVPVGTPPVVYRYMLDHGGRVVRDADGTLIYISQYGQSVPVLAASFEEEVWDE